MFGYTLHCPKSEAEVFWHCYLTMPKHVAAINISFLYIKRAFPGVTNALTPCTENTVTAISAQFSPKYGTFPLGTWCADQFAPSARVQPPT
jgi:hypothetical protein